MDFKDIENRRLVCTEAAARIVSANLEGFVTMTTDPARNKLNVTKAVREVAQLLYVEVSKIG